MVNRCKARNASGNPCSAHVRPDERYYRWHDPKRESERKQWRVKGGKGRSNVTRLRKVWLEEQLTASELSGLLSAALVSTLEGDL